MDWKLLTEKLNAAIVGQHIDINKTLKTDGTWGYYHSEYLDQLVDIVKTLGVRSIVDLGCGTGLLMAQLNCELPYLKVYGLENETRLLLVASDLISCRYIDLEQLHTNDVRDFEALYLWNPFADKPKASKFIETLAKSMNSKQYLVCNNEGSVWTKELIPTSGLFTEIKTKTPTYSIYKLKANENTLYTITNSNTSQ